VTGTDSRKELETAMTEYRKYLSSIINSDAYEKLDRILDPSTYLAVPASPEKRTSMVSGLHSLAVMKNGLLTAEQYALRQLIGNK